MLYSSVCVEGRGRGQGREGEMGKRDFRNIKKNISGRYNKHNLHRDISFIVPENAVII